MGYFDGLTEARFKEGVDGRRIFYPYGVWGSGYILSIETENKIRSFVKWYMKISLVLVIVTVTLFKLYALLLLAILPPYYYMRIRRLLVSERKVTDKLTFREQTINMARSAGLPTCILMVTLSAISFIASIIVIVLFPKGRLIGTVGFFFFGAALIKSIYMLKYATHRHSR